MPVVAFEILSTTAQHASRKPAAHTDRDDSTPFSQMLDKSDNKPAAKADKPDKPEKDASKDAAPSQQQPVAAKGKHHGKGGHAETKAKDTGTPETADAVTIDPTDDTADTDQDTAADFLAVVADVTGIPVAPVDTSKTEAKPTGDSKTDDSKTGDQNKDDAKATDQTADAAKPVTADMAPVAAAVTAPAEAPAAADAAPASAAPATVTIAAQGIVKAAAMIDAAEGKAGKDATKVDAKTDTKTDKPQTAVKLDTPPLLTDPLNSSKQAASPQAPQPQQAQAHDAKPAADTAAQPAKPAQHDTPAPDVASVAKPADTTQPLPLLQNNGLPAAQNTDQTAAAAAPATAPQAAALPVQGIAIEIAGKALDGKKSFDIRLDPPELGKIHVRLDVDHKGEVTSIITADRSDTFDLLRRDAQSLERALNDAGVKTSSGGLQFSLRDQGQQNTPAQFTDTARVVVRDDTLDTETIAPVYRPLSGARAGLDIRV